MSVALPAPVDLKRPVTSSLSIAPTVTLAPATLACLPTGWTLVYQWSVQPIQADWAATDLPALNSTLAANPATLVIPPNMYGDTSATRATGGLGGRALTWRVPPLSMLSLRGAYLP